MSMWWMRCTRLLTQLDRLCSLTVYDQFGVTVHLVQTNRLVQLVLRRDRARIVILVDPLHREQLKSEQQKANINTNQLNQNQQK